MYTAPSGPSSLSHVRRRWACPPEGGTTATHNSILLHSETLCLELVLHPPTPYTLSPLLKGGEGRGEGGSYTHVPCTFGALLFKSCEEEVGMPA